MKKHMIDENRIKTKIRKYLVEQMVSVPGQEKKASETKQRCVSGNVISLDDILGPSKDFTSYISGLNKRDSGINGMIDALDMLRTLRLHPNIKDGGEHLSYSLLNHLNKFRNKNYFDETDGGCLKAMDKVIELYKENEHGEELVRDIEKVLKHQDPTPRAKEYLKRCLLLIKEK